jgi:soluble lytic murein transglycosylase-like protein
MTVRGIQVALVLGFTGFMLVFFSGPLGEPRPGGVGDRAFSSLANPTAMAPKAVPVDEGTGQSPQAELPQPRSATVRGGTGWSPRVPSQIAKLVKRKNLEIVIKKYAHHYGVDEDLVWAVIRQESGFNPDAVSPKGAMGLMQLMPGTADRMGVSDAFDVEQNIAGGIKYLDRCLNQFNQNVPLALAAYNAGPDNVVKYQGCPPFPETRQYVASILQAYADESIRADWKRLSFSPVMEADVPDAVSPRGLPWKIPLPKWRIAAPHCNLGSPRWKVTLRPF